MKNLRGKLLIGLLSIGLAWEAFALVFDGYMIYLQTTGQHEKIHNIVNWFDSNVKGNASS